ncbi:MAG: hypothetical protein JW934_03230 [Anaerolineae bacterium]|nr:hypothetical protein [Anaerolineae bacterium]
MGVWQSPLGFLIALLLAPLALLGSFGLVILGLKVFSIVQKALEPKTEDGGNYTLEQEKEIGKTE